MHVRDLGERQLIQLLTKYMDPKSAALQVPIGDDAAVIQVNGFRYVFTTDMLVEGTHFTSNADWFRLGRKSIAANVSDIGAMGAIPMDALISLAIPGEFTVANLEQLYAGMRAESDKWGVRLSGGDTTRGPILVINIALTGKLTAVPSLRSSAKPGQNLFVTGSLGASMSGLHLQSRPELANAPWADVLRERHFSPEPRPRIGAALAQCFAGDLAMIDISDSLFNELHLLAEASNCGFEIEIARVPIHPVAAEFARATGALADRYALFSGEEYELLFTTSASSKQVISCAKEAEPAVAVTCIGRVIRGSKIIFIDESGKERPYSDETFKHF